MYIFMQNLKFARLGFGQKWRDLICILWAHTTSRILLNGIICIDKKEIKKIRCYPAFYVEAKEEGRNISTN